MGKLKPKKNPTLQDHEKRSPQGLDYSTKLHGAGIEARYIKGYIILQHIAKKQSKEKLTTQTQEIKVQKRCTKKPRVQLKQRSNMQGKQQTKVGGALNMKQKTGLKSIVFLSYEA